jgi:hypothetical protein
VSRINSVNQRRAELLDPRRFYFQASRHVACVRLTTASLIIDHDEVWTCCYCGAPIGDEIVDRIFDQLRAAWAEPRSTIDDVHHHALEVTLPGACTACGGGRVAARLGEVGRLG